MLFSTFSDSINNLINSPKLYGIKFRLERSNHKPKLKLPSLHNRQTIGIKGVGVIIFYYYYANMHP
jgi:hypothetical protein